MPRFSCPKCKTTLKPAAEQAGKIITCPKCQAKLKVPSSVPQPRPAQPAPPPVPAQTESEWYYAKSGQKIGPVTLEQLKELVRSGELSPADMVWKQGMAKWIQANQVGGVFESGPSKEVPPPHPPAATPLPVAEWYFIKDGQQHGPVTAEQLRGAITSSDLVWRAGLTQWVAASTIPGLFPAASQPVPPIPGASKSKSADRSFKPAPSSSTKEILEVLPADKGSTPRDVPVNRVTFELSLPSQASNHQLDLFLDGDKIATGSAQDGIPLVQLESTIGTHTLTLQRTAELLGMKNTGKKTYQVHFKKPGHYTLKFTMGWIPLQFPTGIESSYSPQALAPLPVSGVRRKSLCGSWQAIAESHQAVEFTEDGAVLFSDGSAGRFTATGKAPNEVIEMEMVNGQTRQFKIISLAPDQLVISEGTEARTFRRAASPVSTPIRATQQAVASGMSGPSPPSSASNADIALAHFNRGIDHQKRGDHALALAEFADAVRLDPSNDDYRNGLAVGHYNRGVGYTKQGDKARALADFAEAFRLNPTDEDCRRNLAITHYNRGIDYEEKGDNARALSSFKEASRLYPNDADYREAVAMAERGQVKAEAPTDEAMESGISDPAVAGAVPIKASASHAKGTQPSVPAEDEEIVAAIAALEKQVEEADKKARVTGDWAHRHALNRDLHVLKQQYSRILKARRKAAAAKGDKEKGHGERPRGSSPVLAGEGEMDAGRFAESMAHVQQANKHRRVGEWDQAIHESSVAINLFPRNHVAYFERGLALNGKGNGTHDAGLFTAAVGDLTTAIEIGIDDPGALAEMYYNRGCILTDDLGRHEEAIEDFHQALELDPSAYQAQQGLQRAQAAAQNDVRPAEAKRLVPNDPSRLAEVYARRGMDYHNKGDDVRALAEFKEAHRLDPNREDFRKSLAALHGNLAMQYVHNKDWAQAKAELEEAVRLDPEKENYRECLAELDSALRRTGQRESSSSAGASPSSPVKKREPGLWHRFKSAMSPNTNKCPNCGENLGGEDAGTELIDREEGIQTRMKMDVTDHGSGQQSRTFRDEQVIVYHDTCWQYLKCKFCDHEWREQRETTYQP